ncbi:MAG: VWA domain-containing protein [Christensenella sp.]|nr:VWA domain-containing protein [Christensenella sp.]
MKRTTGKSMRRALSLLLFCALSMGAFAAASAAGEARLNLESANVSGDVLQLIFYDDAEEAPSAENLSISVDGTVVPAISVNPIDYADPGTSYLFLLDTNTAVTERALPDMQSMAKSLVEKLGVNDNALILPIGQPIEAKAFSDDKDALNASVDALTRGDSETDLYSSMSDAIRLLENDTTLRPRRCLVVMADGLDNTSAGISALEVSNQVSQSHVPVYLVALTYNTKTPARVQAAKDISGIARLSPGGVSILLKNDGVTTSDAVDSILAQREHTYLAALKGDAVRAAAKADTAEIALTQQAGVTALSATRTVSIAGLPTLAPAATDTPAPRDTIAPSPTPAATPEPDDKDEVTLPLWVLYSAGGLVLLAILAVVIIATGKKRVKKQEQNGAIARFAKSEEPFVQPKQENPAICIVLLGKQETIVFQGSISEPISLGEGEDSPILPKTAEDEAVISRLVWRDGTVWAMQNREDVLVNGSPARKNACLSVGDVLRIADADYRIFYSANE